MRLRKYGMECPKDDAAKLLRHGVVLLAALLLVCTLMAGAVSASAPQTFADLKNNLTTGQSFTLQDDITVTGYTDMYVNVTGSPTLDLNGHKITGTTLDTGSKYGDGRYKSTNSDTISSLFNVSGEVSSTGQDSSSEKDGNITVSNGYSATIFFVGGKGTLTIKNGNFSATGVNLCVGDGGKAIIENGNFQSDYLNLYPAELAILEVKAGNFVSKESCAYIIGTNDYAKAPHVDISGGTFTATNYGSTLTGNGISDGAKFYLNISSATITSTSVGIYLPSDAKVKIHNTQVTGTKQAITLKAGTLDITGNSVIKATGQNGFGTKPNDGDSPNSESGSAIELDKGKLSTSTQGYYGSVQLNIADTTQVISENGAAIRTYIIKKNLENGISIDAVVISDTAKLQGALADIDYRNFTNPDGLETYQVLNMTLPVSSYLENNKLSVMADGVKREISFNLNGGTSTDGTFTIEKGHITLPKDPTSTSKVFSGWSDGTSLFKAEERVASTSSATYTAQYTDTTTTITGSPNGWQSINLSDSAAIKEYTLTASVADVAWTVPTTGSNFTSISTSGNTVTFTPSPGAQVGTYTFTATPTNTQITPVSIVVNLYKPAEAKAPTTTIDMTSDTKVTADSSATVESTTDPNVAIIEKENAKIVVTYTAPVTVDETAKTATSSGSISSVSYIQPELPAAVTDPDATGSSIQISLTTTDALIATNEIPKISLEPVVKEADVDKVKTEFFSSTIHVAAMIYGTYTDGTTTKDALKTITMKTTIPAAFFTGKTGTPFGFHMNGDAVTEITLKEVTTATDTANGVRVFELTGPGFSGYGVGTKFTTTPPSPPAPQSVSFSGDGNMNNTFRVLFNNERRQLHQPLNRSLLRRQDQSAARTNQRRLHLRRLVQGQRMHAGMELQ